MTEAELSKQLQAAGLRATRPRLALGALLWRKGNRHITADGLYAEAKQAGLRVSLATIYNTLHQFHDAGLLREVVVSPTQQYYDTNVSHHHHFFVEDTQELVDIEATKIKVRGVPKPPKDKKVASVDVVVRLNARK